MSEANLPSKIMSFQEEKAVREKIKELENVRDNVEVVQGVNFETKDKPSITKEIRRLEGVLAGQAASEIELSQADRDKLSKEEELLRAQLQKGMPTWDVYTRTTPRDGPRYHNLVNWVSKANEDRERRAKIQRWKTVRRLLDPHTPKADSTYHLFQ